MIYILTIQKKFNTLSVYHQCDNDKITKVNLPCKTHTNSEYP